MFKDQQGAVITVFILLIIPLLLVGLFATNNFSKTVHDYDVSLQNGVSEAVRNAAFMVNKNTLALGKPTINPKEAHNAFKKVLFSHTPEKQVESYTFVVYNGYGDGGEVYIFRKGSTDPVTSTIGAGYSAVFTVTTNDVVIGNGANAVTMTEPGCIAVVGLKPDNFLKNDEDADPGYRWAASTIVLAKDFY